MVLWLLASSKCVRSLLALRYSQVTQLEEGESTLQNGGKGANNYKPALIDKAGRFQIQASLPPPAPRHDGQGPVIGIFSIEIAIDERSHASV
jgi:hypothetical protein